MRRSILISLAAAAVLKLLMPHAIAHAKLSVFVSIAPVRYFVQQIGQDLVEVRTMVQTGADPHTYEPRPQQMVAIARAKLYFAVGIEFERANLDKIVSSNPNLKVVHLDHGIKKIPMAGQRHQEQADEQHKEVGNHTTGALQTEDRHAEDSGLDPHIWLSPPLVKIQARKILAALLEIDPANQSVYEANYRQFLTGIDDLDSDLKKIFAGQRGLQFMVFHPAWGYFAHAYGLEQLPIEIEGKNPKPAHLKNLIEHARERDIKIIFVQPQFSAKNAEIVAREIGGQVAFANPLAEDWLANLRQVADQFKAALR